MTPYSGTLTLERTKWIIPCESAQKLYQKIVAEAVYNCFRSPFHVEQCEPLYWVQKQVHLYEFLDRVQNICVIV